MGGGGGEGGEGEGERDIENPLTEMCGFDAWSIRVSHVNLPLRDESTLATSLSTRLTENNEAFQLDITEVMFGRGPANGFREKSCRQNGRGVFLVIKSFCFVFPRHFLFFFFYFSMLTNDHPELMSYSSNVICYIWWQSQSILAPVEAKRLTDRRAEQ